MPRRIALKVLIDLDKAHKNLQECLNDALNESELEIRDRSLATELIYSYLRNETRIQYILNSYLKEPQKIPRNLYLSMALSSSELLNLSKVPAYATINFTVDHCKKKFGLGMSKLVNAVLRQIDRDREKLLDDKQYSLAIRYSLAPELYAILEANFSAQDLIKLAKNFLTTPKSAFRVNSSYLDAKALHFYYTKKLGLKAETEQSFSLSRKLSAKDHKELEQNITSGKLSRQGLGSLLLLDRIPVEYLQNEIIDACAGHGGKALYLLERGFNLVQANDVNKKRLFGLESDIKRLQLPKIRITNYSATDLRFADYPQTIILDVPCSGLGTLARRPDIKRNISLAKLQELESLQADILTSTWQKMALGSTIIYITCTIRQEENETQISKLLTDKPNQYTRLDLAISLDFELDGRDLLFASIITKTS